MFIKHYIYSCPWFLPDGTPVKEEYELYKDGILQGIFYTNPDPSLPIKVIYD